MKNPLLWLELRIRIRERKLWIISLLYLLCLLAMSFVPLLLIRNDDSADPAQPGILIFSFEIFTLLALLAIISPLSSAAAISQEREQRTLPGLLNTPLSAFRIAFGKLVATWIFIFWLLALALPFLFAAALWCGIGWGKLFSVLGLILAAGMVTSTIALGLSGYFQRTVTSYIATGIFFFFWFIVWPLLGVLSQSLFLTTATNDRGFLHLFYIFLAHHPATPLVLLLQGEFGEPVTNSFDTGHAILFALAVWLVLGAIFFLIACRGLRRALTGKS